MGWPSTGSSQCVPDAATRRAIGENAYRFYFGSP